MEPKDRIIVALDYPRFTPEVEGVVNSLRDFGITHFKAGLQIVTAEGAPKIAFIMKNKGANLFLDLKLNDIPNTVAGTARAIVGLGGVDMFNVHALGGEAMMKAAAEAAKDEAEKLGCPRPLVLGVTILTSLDSDELAKVGLLPIGEKSLGSAMSLIQEDEEGIKRAEKAAKELVDIGVRELVVKLAKLAKKSGLDGVVCSGREIEAIREACGPDFLLVVPGIRPKWAAAGDQKRIVTPSDALKRGADFLVIGRPATDPPKEVGGPVEAVKRILDEIAAAMGEAGK